MLLTGGSGACTHLHSLIGLPGPSNSGFHKGLREQLLSSEIPGTGSFAMQKASMQIKSLTANLFISLTSSSASNIWSFPCQAGLQVVLGSNRPHGHHVPIYSSSNSLYIQEEASEDDTNYYPQIEMAFWPSLKESVWAGGRGRNQYFFFKKSIEYVMGSELPI